MEATRSVTKSQRPQALPNRVPEWVMPFIKLGVAAVDILIAAASFLLAFRLREGAAIFSGENSLWSEEFSPYSGILIAAIIVRFAMLLYQRVYRFHGVFSYVQEGIRIFKAVAVGSLIIVSWAFLFRGGFAYRDFSYSRAIFVLDFLIALALYLLFHLLIRAIQTKFRKRGINLVPTLVVGTNAEALQTVRELERRPDLGFKIVGIVRNGNDAEPEPETGELGGIPIVGAAGELADLIRELRIQEVIITDDSVRGESLFDVMMQTGRSRRVEFRFAPRFFDLLPQKTSVEQIGVLPMVRLFREPLSDTDRLIKRLSDIVIASFALLITFPVWLIAMLLVRFSSRGPIFFRQNRVGMDGRIFQCYKFRTMFADADDSMHREAYKRNIEGEKGEGGLHGKIKDDPRVTPVGRFLRRWSIDELPQLLNVLKGDMSIVGPRPPIPYEVEEYDLEHRKRLDMKPGITGLWQVSGRSTISFEEMVRLDLFYIENWSLLLDIKIILLTIPAIFRGEGAE